MRRPLPRPPRRHFLAIALGRALALSVMLSACRAQVVELRKPVAGPVKEVGWIDPGGGHLRYALKGGEMVHKRRRADAFKRMARHCGGAGRVRITKEYLRDDAETPYHAFDLEASTIEQDLPHYKVDSYRHIEFSCAR